MAFCLIIKAQKNLWLGARQNYPSPFPATFSVPMGRLSASKKWSHASLGCWITTHPKIKNLPHFPYSPWKSGLTVLLHLLLFLKYPGILRFQQKQIRGLTSASGSKTCDLGTAQPWLCIIGRIASPPEGPRGMWVWACQYFLWLSVHGPGHLYSTLFPSQRMNKSFICDHVVHTRHLSPESPSLVYFSHLVAHWIPRHPDQGTMIKLTSWLWQQTLTSLRALHSSQFCLPRGSQAPPGTCHFSV